MIKVTIKRTDRTYIKDDKVIACYESEIAIGKISGTVKLKKVMFHLFMKSKEDAEMLMDDLYYGEYDGA